MSSTQSSENIFLNKIFLEHIDIDFTLRSYIKIDRREAFQNLYSEIFYSLYLDIFDGLDGMFLMDDLFLKHISCTNSLTTPSNIKMKIRDEELFRWKLMTSSKLPSIDQFSIYLDKEWEMYEIFWNKVFHSDEGPEERDIATHPKFSQVYHLSHPCEENWVISKIFHERMPYLKLNNFLRGKKI